MLREMNRVCVVSRVALGFLVAMLLVSPASAQSVGLFTIYGSATIGGIDPLPTGSSLRIERFPASGSGSSVLVSTDDFQPATYNVVFSDFDGNKAAEIGDRFRVTVVGPDQQDAGSKEKQVEAVHLQQFGMRLDVVAVEVGVESTSWAAIKNLYR